MVQSLNHYSGTVVDVLIFSRVWGLLYIYGVFCENTWRLKTINVLLNVKVDFTIDWLLYDGTFGV